MTPSLPHFFSNWPLRPRFIFAEAPQIQEWVVSSKMSSEDSEVLVDPLGQDIDDLSKDLAKSALLREIKQGADWVEADWAEKVPADKLERAFGMIREDMKTILAGLADNAGRINDQIKEIIRLSAAASARHVCERLRVEMENVLLFEESQKLQVSNQELRLANEELAIKAEIDFLTGLPNRRALAQRLQEEVVRADRTKKPLCVLMFDLDRFKEVNTEYGHIKGGDAVLRELGHRFLHGEIGQKIMRDFDFVGRYGGDEIIIILPNADAEGAKIVAHRIVRALEKDPVFIDVGQDKLVKADVGASIGIGIFEGKEQDPTGEKMCIDADRCLKICKGEDKDRFGIKQERRGHIAVEGKVYAHEDVAKMIHAADTKEVNEPKKPQGVVAPNRPFVFGPR